MSAPLSAVLIVAFNRPDTLTELVRVLETTEPSREVYFSVDAPRPSQASDAANVSKVVEIIRGFSRFRPENLLVNAINLGVRRGPEAAITWFFSLVERGIILEDDCIPGPSFFQFMDHALEAYHNEPRVRVISGFNPFQAVASKYSAFWIKTAYTWGWGTWRRSWAQNDPDLSIWDPGDAALMNWVKPKAVYAHWCSDARGVLDGRLRAWDIPFALSIFRGEGIVLMPHVSLVRNIGFGGNATHTSVGDDRRLIVAMLLDPPYQFPPLGVLNLSFQRRLDRKFYWSFGDTAWGCLVNGLKRIKRRLFHGVPNIDR